MLPLSAGLNTTPSCPVTNSLVSLARVVPFADVVARSVSKWS